jgi:hypothetical protein
LDSGTENQRGAEGSKATDTDIDNGERQKIQSQYESLMGNLRYVKSVVVSSNNELVLLFERLGSEEIGLEFWSRKIEDWIRENQ